MKNAASPLFRMTRHALVSLTMALTMVLGATTPAFADFHEGQSQVEGDAEDAAFWAGTGLTTTTVGLALTTAGGIVLIVLLARKDEKAMKTYIRQNALALQHDISTGGGQTIDDLAHAFQVPADEHAAFGKALRAQRDTLLPLVDADTITDARAAQFIDALIAAVAAEPTLADNIFGLRLGATG